MKQHKTIKAAAVICMLLYFSISNAQLTSSPLGKQPELPSWETYEFMKYGNIGASPYTGTVNYSVPIYTYKDNDFNVSFSVDYSTNGFRVNHKSGKLGQSWILSGAGKITREIRGIPDERTIQIGGGLYSMSSPHQMFGFKYLTETGLSRELVLDDNAQVHTCLMQNNAACYDSESDIYTFSFCGYSGSFRRTVPTSSNPSGFIYFDESGESMSIKVKSLNETGKIVLVDGNGYEYQFDISEYTKEPADNSVGSTQYDRYVSWDLTKIIAPNGRYVQYFYSSSSGIYDGSTIYTPTLSYYNASTNLGTIIGIPSSNFNMSINIQRMRNTRLTGVLFPDSTRLIVNYENGEPEWAHSSPNGTLSKVHDDSTRVKSISISHLDRILKTNMFSYVVKRPTSGSGNPITFLSSISISGQGVFSFDYYDVMGYPALGSIKSDHWGFYNGESGGFPLTNLTGCIHWDSCYNETYSYTVNKNPNYDFALSGALKSIHYPTGGYSVINYEPHSCSAQISRTSQHHFLPYLEELSNDKTVGGIRIKSVISYLSDSTAADTTEYKYCKFDSVARSSGILLNVPRYGIEYYTEGRQKHVTQFNLANHIFDFSNTHIEYSHVREYKSGRGYKDYFYSSCRDFPDYFNADLTTDEDKSNRRQVPCVLLNENNEKISARAFCNPSPYVTNILTPVPSLQNKRGLLLQEDCRNDEGTLLKRMENSYDFPLVETDTALCITGETSREVYYPRFNIELSYSKETDYFNNNHVSKETHYTYNKNGMPTSVTTSVSDSGTIVERNVYSGDSIVSDSSVVIAKMQENNIVNELLVSQTMKSGCLLNKVRYNYYLPDASNNALVRPASVEIWNPTDGWRQKSSYLFDNMGLLRQVTDASGMNTSYLWSYCGKHPVAIAQNASWQSLEQGLSATGCGTSDQLTARANLDDASFERLGTLGTYLPEASVNLYKYKLNAGISEVTMPNSLRTFYSYDGYGRLTSISDNNKKKLEQNEYYMQSIKPLTASMSCPTNCHVNDSISISATSQGGTGSYSYYWSIKNSDGNTIYSVTTSSGILDIVPSAIPNLVANDYTVECVVTDLVSEETVNMVSSLCVNHAKIEFSGISASFDLGSGSGTAIATIYTDTPVTVSFSVHCICSGQCTLKIGDTLCADTVSNGTYSYSFEAGITNVKLQVNSSFAETNVSLQIESAGDADGLREIGSSNTINLEF